MKNVSINPGLHILFFLREKKTSKVARVSCLCRVIFTIFGTKILSLDNLPTLSAVISYIQYKTVLCKSEIIGRERHLGAGVTMKYVNRSLENVHIH
jgi:hypothetical protein